MKTFKLILAANETRVANVNGEFFFLRYTQYPLVEIKLLDRNGGTVSILEDAVTTDWDRTGQFERVEITNGPNPQTIYFRYGNGDTGSNVFSGSVDGSIVSLDAPTIAALIARMQARPATGSTASSAALAANTPETLVTAAGNPNGLLVKGAGLVGQTGANIWGKGGLIAKASAPASVTDGLVLETVRPFTHDEANTNYIWGLNLQQEIFVPAGLGLYWMLDAAISVGQMRWSRVAIL